MGGLWYWEENQSGEGSDYDDAFGIVELPDGKNATGDDPLPEVGRAAPDFVLEKPGGGTLRLSDLQGSPCWSISGRPGARPAAERCRNWSTPTIATEAQGLVVVGVDLQETDDQVNEFADDFGVDFPLVVDRDSEVADAWRIGGPFEGLPSSYFIDAEGVVQERSFGPLDEELIDERLASILPGATG